MLNKPYVVIISPAMAKANNGNWQTAYRWARHLRDRYHVTIHSSAEALPEVPVPRAVIALHARRSARVIAQLAERCPDVPMALVLTGTDLYRDIHDDADAQRSLQLASRLIVLQEAGIQELPANLHHKSDIIYQSAPMLKPVLRNTRRHFRVIMVGHLRDEKDPATYMQAASQVSSPNVRLLHIGGALDPELGTLAQVTQQTCPRYQWLGNLPHATTRQRLKYSDLMVICSRMEGGANVIIEAVTSGVPVLASDISGNRGMLGQDYAGYFPLGNATELARLIDRAATDPVFYVQLQSQCAARAPLFSPAREKAAVLQLVDNLVQRNCLSRITEQAYS